MKNNILEQIILYIIVVCVALVIATLARISAAAMGFDGFTTFMVFIITFAILVVVYLSIHAFLQGLMLSCIEKRLSKIPYFRRKIKSIPVTNEIPKNIIEQEPVLSLDDIRNKQLQNKTKQQKEKLNIALDYTRKTFAPYVSDEQIELLCENIQLYVDKLGLETLQPVKVSEDLTTIDIYHFGWNIWNHFQVSDQMQVARFLKTVFVHTFREVEDIETIKKKLKIFEPKCKIQIQENLSE
jgi:hypothetical protein